MKIRQGIGHRQERVCNKKIRKQSGKGINQPFDAHLHAPPLLINRRTHMPHPLLGNGWQASSNISTTIAICTEQWLTGSISPNTGTRCRTSIFTRDDKWHYCCCCTRSSSHSPINWPQKGKSNKATMLDSMLLLTRRVAVIAPLILHRHPLSSSGGSTTTHVPILQRHTTLQFCTGAGNITWKK